jgi:hypothetical protein
MNLTRVAMEGEDDVLVAREASGARLRKLLVGKRF